MQDKKNDLMLRLSAAAAALCAVVFAITRQLDPFRHHAGGHGSGFGMTPAIFWGQLILVLVPFGLLAFALYCFRQNREHPYLPWLNTLTLTFSSMAIISGSGGGVEFHFSIFMVLAMAAYYEDIRLMVLMTTLFAVQHLAGFFLSPQLVFGTDSYPFLMLVIHALFLILTSCATSLQIVSKRKITTQLEAEKRTKEERLFQLINQIEKLSEQIRSTSETVSDKSEINVRANETMRHSFDEVTGGLRDQLISLEQMDSNLERINGSVQSAFFAFEEMKLNAVATEQAVTSNYESVLAIREQNESVVEAVTSIVMSMDDLQQAAAQAQSMVNKIREVSDQTNLIALNASIEAARAGEQGKGFAVVAGEIRKLADQSRGAADDIQSMIAAIRQESETSVGQVERGQEAIRQTAVNMETFAAEFQQLRQRLREVLEFILNLNRMMTDIRQEAGNVSGEMTRISAVIEEEMAAMESLRGMSGEQTESARQVDREVAKLNDLSLSLREQFKA